MVFKSVQVVIITLLLKNLRASHSSVASGNFFEDVHIAGPTYASSSGLTPTIHFHKCTREKECNYLILNVKNGTLQHMTKLPAAFPSKADEELKVWRKITEGPCPLRYSSVGCFDNHNGGSLKLLVSNERDTSSIKWNRHLIDWAIFEDLLPGIVCRCLMTAASHGSTIAGVMNYGECWSLSNGSELEYHRQRPSDDCVRGTLIEKCTAEDRLCVGKIHGTYIYKIIA